MRALLDPVGTYAKLVQQWRDSSAAIVAVYRSLRPGDDVVTTLSALLDAVGPFTFALNAAQTFGLLPVLLRKDTVIAVAEVQRLVEDCEFLGDDSRAPDTDAPIDERLATARALAWELLLRDLQVAKESP